MVLEFILFLVAGVIVGTFTGLTPGIHTNLIVASLASLASSFTEEIKVSPLIVFIVSLSIAHTFIDFIPSIFLGAPDEDTVLATLPGHRFLISGKGHTAVCLTLIGSITAIGIFILIIPFFLFVLPKVYGYIQRMLGWILIWISILLISYEKSSKLNAFILFALSGFLGVGVLNSQVDQPLLPLLTGLFGSSTLVYSIKTKTTIPKQIIEKIKIKKRDLIKPSIATALISPIFSLLPGLGSSQAAIVGSKIIGEQSEKQFMILLGSINTLVMSVSFVTLFMIQKSRTGAANAISMLTSLNQQTLLMAIVAVIFSSLLAFPIAASFSRLFAKNIHKIPYSRISFLILLALISLTFVFSGIVGLLIFFVSTLLGLLCTEMRVRKGLLMGSLLIPTILFYLPF